VSSLATRIEKRELRTEGGRELATSDGCEENRSVSPYLAIGDVDAEINVAEGARADLPHQPVLAAHDELILYY